MLTCCWSSSLIFTNFHQHPVFLLTFSHQLHGISIIISFYFNLKGTRRPPPAHHSHLTTGVSLLDEKNLNFFPFHVFFSLLYFAFHKQREWGGGRFYEERKKKEVWVWKPGVGSEKVVFLLVELRSRKKWRKRECNWGFKEYNWWILVIFE